MTLPQGPGSTGLHIAIDARTINSSTGTVIVNMLAQLQAIDHRNRYTVLLDRADRDYWRPESERFTVMLTDAPQYSLAEQIGLRRQLRALAPDLVHFCMPQQPLGTFRGRKVTSFHDLTTLRIRNPHLSTLAFLIKNAIGWTAFRTAARESAAVIACSEWTRQDVITSLGVPAERVRTIYDAGVERRPEVLRPVEHGFDRFLLYVGSQFAYKNIQRLCDAHQQLRQSHPGLGLILVGRPDRETAFTQRYCQVRGYRDVLFTGYLPDDQRDWLYVNAAAYVFPSLLEGFGLPGLEAMSYGTPVVSSDRTCLPEIYGDAVVYFDPEDVGMMARQIAAVLDDDALRATMVERGRAQLARYSWRRMAEQVLAVYEEVGAPHDRRRWFSRSRPAARQSG